MKALVVLLLCGGTALADDATDVPALLDSWVRAQDDRSFDAYSALYAPTFTGIRRVGARRVALDHDGWLRDRKRMFAHKLHVTATDVVVRGLELRFTQTFETGSFSDVGPKHMTLERDATGVHIVREEMLASTVLPRPFEGAPALERLAFVWDGELVVEADASEATRAAVGPLKAIEHANDLENELRGDLATAQLPNSLRALEGKRFRVFGEHAEVCTAHVGTRFSVRAKSGWLVPDEGQKPLPTTVADLAALANASFISLRTVTALVADSGDCSHGRWARALDSTSPVVLPKADREVERVAKKKARAERARIHHFQAVSFRLGDRAIVYLNGSVGDPCGDGAPFDSLEAIYDVRGKTAVETFRTDNRQRDLRVIAAVDLDGDGVPELIVGGGFVGKTQLDGAILRLEHGHYVLNPVLETSTDLCLCG